MFDLAIIGLGAWGKRLIGSVQGKSDTVRFTRTVTRTVAKAMNFAEDHGLELGDDYGALLGDAAVNGVVVCGQVAILRCSIPTSTISSNPSGP